jgi:hypothetical protein
MESLSGTVDQTKDKLPELKDKEDLLEQSDEEKGNKTKKYNGTCKTSSTLLKDQTYKSWA